MTASTILFTAWQLSASSSPQQHLIRLTQPHSHSLSLLCSPPPGSQAWDSPTTGLVINERLLNSPPQLAPPLVQALFDEISWATEDMPKQARCCKTATAACSLPAQVSQRALQPGSQMINDTCNKAVCDFFLQCTHLHQLGRHLELLN